MWYYMGVMRKFLVHLLMLLMFTPGLVCGPFMAAGKVQAAVTQMPDMPDCHGMVMDKDVDSKKSSADHSTMLFKDCAKVDVFSADHAVLKKPDMEKAFFIAWADMPSQPSFTPANFHVIRGPPPDWPDISKTKPSIILITQRFRE